MDQSGDFQIPLVVNKVLVYGNFLLIPCQNKTNICQINSYILNVEDIIAIKYSIKEIVDLIKQTISGISKKQFRIRKKFLCKYHSIIIQIILLIFFFSYYKSYECVCFHQFITNDQNEGYHFDIVCLRTTGDSFPGKQNTKNFGLFVYLYYNMILYYNMNNSCY